MGAEEPNLTLEIRTSITIEEKVLELGKKFVLAIGTYLEVSGKNEWFTRWDGNESHLP